MRKLNEELTKNDVENIFSRRESSMYSSSDFKKAVRQIAAEAIEDLYKTLWNRSSTWKSGVAK